MKKNCLLLVLLMLCVFVSKGQIKPTFTKQNVPELSERDSAYTEVFDFNNDGYADIVSLNWASKYIKIHLNDKTGHFSVYKTLLLDQSNDYYFSNLMIGDFDNDLFDDLLISFQRGKKPAFYVFKNINGTDFIEFVSSKNFTIRDEENDGNRFIFCDIDRDNDLDILSGNNTFQYLDGEFVGSNLFGWPNFDLNNFKIGNPNTYGGINLVYDRFEKDRLRFYPTLSINLDTFVLFENTTRNWIRSGKDLIYLNLDSLPSSDYFYIEEKSNDLIIKVSQGNGKHNLDTVPSGDMFRWDVGDMDGDGDVDLVYSVLGGGVEKISIILLKYEIDSDNVATVTVSEKNKNVASRLSSSISLKLIDVDFDNDLDIVNSNDVYLNNMTNSSIEGSFKPYGLSVDYIKDNGAYEFQWLDSTNNFNVLRYELIMQNDKKTLKNYINNKNTFNTSRLPTTALIPHKTYAYLSSDTGWVYWSVRSINPILQGSYWATIDSVYVSGNRIIGNTKPCIGEKGIYYMQHSNSNITNAVFSLKGSNIEIIKNQNVLELVWSEAGPQTIEVIRYNGSAIVDKLYYEVFVRSIPVYDVYVPENVCIGSQVSIKNIANNSKDFEYRWFIFPQGIPYTIYEGDGVDSIGFVMSDRKTTIRMVINENDEFCSTSYLTEGESNNLTKNINPISPSDINSEFTTDEIVCGNEFLKINLVADFNNFNNYNWDVDGANIIKNESDSLLLLDWGVNETKQISLQVEEFGCLSSVFQKTVLRKPKPEVLFDVASISCHSTLIPLSFTGSASTDAQFTWNFDNADQINGQGKGPYELLWNTGGIKEISLKVDDGGCVTDSIFVVEISEALAPQPLCGVSVNAKKQAVIFWQKPLGDNVDTVYVYKESSQSNVYEKLHAFGVNEATSFTDTSTDCSAQPYRFKLGLKDTCGFEPELSDYHKTIHLMLNKGQNSSWNLIWTDYEGLEVGTYSIYRGATTENMSKVADVSGNVYSYTDQFPPLGDLYYAIVVSNTPLCDIGTKSASLDLIQIQSNIAETKLFSGLSDVVFNQLFTFNVKGKVLNIITETTTSYSYEITSITGQNIVISEPMVGTLSKDLSHIQSGIYFVIIYIDGDRKMRKIKL